jgi:hypothetical protein
VIVQLEAAEYAISEGDRQDANRHLRQAGELARRSLSEGVGRCMRSGPKPWRKLTFGRRSKV